MTNLIACRLCLLTDGPMYNIKNTPLQTVYEELTNVSLQSYEERPTTACMLCYNSLKRCLILKTKALKSEELLSHLSQFGIVNQNSISSIDRQLYNLCSSLCVSLPESVYIDGTYVDIKMERNSPAPKIDEDVKSTELIPENNIHSDSDYLDSIFDTEDEVPLKKVKVENSSSKKHIGKVVTKKHSKIDYKLCFTKKVSLTKEQQLEEFKTRMTSVNYLHSAYSCDECYRGFTHMKSYQMHQMKHDVSRGPYVCNICRMRYPSERTLKRHSVASHYNRYLCGRCTYVSHTMNQATDHEKWHNGFTFSCDLCGLTFNRRTSYLSHLRKFHPSGNVCELCGESFISAQGLVMHKSKTHGLEHTKDIDKSESGKYCSECNIQFLSLEAWQRHLLKAAKHIKEFDRSPQCGICGESIPPGAHHDHREQHMKQLNLRVKKEVSRRMKTEARCGCDDCGSTFASRLSLIAHIKRMHLGHKYGKNIVCDVCGMKFISNATLKYHQRTHTGEKPYACSWCGKRFRDTNILKIHARTHTGEKPYVCNTCGKKFPQKPALNRHNRVHTGAKPYKCPHCVKCFSQSNSMKVHVQTVHLKIPVIRKRRKRQDTTKDKDEDAVLQHLY